MAAIDSLPQAGIVWYLARVAPDGKGKEKVRANDNCNIGIFKKS